MSERPDTERPVRIVLVEDSPEMILYIKSTLHEFEIRDFENPLDSYSSLPEADLVLLDYHLPEMDGLEYLESLKTSYPGLPVIMITSHGSEDVCQSAFRLGVRDYIRKPFGVRELREIVFQLLEQIRDKSEITKEQEHEISPAVFNKLYLAKHYIDQNIDRKIMLDEVLKHVGMSKTPFERYFKRQFGAPFRDYVLQRKIEQAKELLKKGTSVSEVAVALGFSDVSYFSKMFKKFTGSRPSGYKPE